MPRSKYKPIDLDRDLSESAKKNIDAARTRAVSNLLDALRRYWEQVPFSAEKFRVRDPFEVVPLFDAYAETQYDAYAEELLPRLPDVDKYHLHLATDVTDVISNAIRPSFLIPDGIPSQDQWTDLIANWQNLTPETRELLSGPPPEPNGDWEIYLARSFNMRMLQGKVKSHAGPSLETASAMFRQLFVVKYQLYLRPLLNNLGFDKRLRASLSDRLAHWRTVAMERNVVGSALAQNIKRLMKECGCSYNLLAELTGIQKTSILDHVNKGVRPQPETLIIYAQTFTDKSGREVTVSELET